MSKRKYLRIALSLDMIFEISTQWRITLGDMINLGFAEVEGDHVYLKVYYPPGPHKFARRRG